MKPKRFQYTFPTKSGHSIAVNANSHDEALRGVNETLIIDPNLCEMRQIKSMENPTHIMHKGVKCPVIQCGDHQLCYRGEDDRTHWVSRGRFEELYESEE